MEDLKKKIESSRHAAQRLIIFGAKHRFILLYIILASAIAFALVRTREYIDVPRDETKFQNEISTIKYKEIDKEILNSFAQAQKDGTIDVSSQFDAQRSNPFVD